MTHTFLSDELLEYIETRNWKAVASKDLSWPEPELIAPELIDTLNAMDKPDQVLFFRALPRNVAVEVFSELDPDTSDSLLLSLTNAETRRLLENLNPDDRTEILGELPGQVTQRLLTLLGPEDLKEARQLLGYPDESVGRLMTPDYLAVRADWTMSEALSHIRKHGHESEMLNVIYVTDARGKLIDALPLQRFLLAPPESRVRDIMDDTYISISAYEDQEEAVRLMQKYDRLAIPVVDSQGILLGIVTFDDVFHIAEEEATEDFHRSAAVTPLKRSYWETGPWVLFRARIGWLAILVMVSLVSSGVIAAFEETLATFVALTFFIPMIIGTGGNAGSQSATLMIRSISTDDVRMNDWLKVFLKEVFIGLMIGVTLGVIGFTLGWFRGGHMIGVVVFATMITMLVATNLIGILLPFVLTRARLDPAIASGPLITSVADAVGLLIYFSYARALLGI
jgi:magnesium transporter